MNRREVDVDALFERDADTRLLERRRREELGLAPLAPAGSSTQPSFGSESMVAAADDVAPRGALLRVALEARPDAALIPGAVVTIVAAVHDDGDVSADDVTIRIALPPEAQPLAGTFARDETEIDGDALLGEGLRIGSVPAGGAVRLRFSVRVLPGTEPLDVLAHASAPRVAALGTPTLRLGRRSGHAAYETPRPFYELEAGETDEAPEPPPAAAVAPPPAAATLDVVVDEPLVLPVLAEPEPGPAPEPQPEPAPVPEPPPVVPPEAVLWCRFAVEDARALDRIFAGEMPHGLAALALLAGIACTAGPLGDALGLEPFRAAVAASLPRALVAARMRRPTPPIVTADALATIRPDGAAESAGAPPGGAALVARFDARELDALRAVLRRESGDAFLRGVQLLLAAVPRELDGVPAGAGQRAAAALAAYRVAAGAWLMRVTVRRAVDKRYDPLVASDAALHDTGAALVSVLREVLG